MLPTPTVNRTLASFVSNPGTWFPGDQSSFLTGPLPSWSQRAGPPSGGLFSYVWFTPSAHPLQAHFILGGGPSGLGGGPPCVGSHQSPHLHLTSGCLEPKIHPLENRVPSREQNTGGLHKAPSLQSCRNLLTKTPSDRLTQHHAEPRVGAAGWGLAGGKARGTSCWAVGAGPGGPLPKLATSTNGLGGRSQEGECAPQHAPLLPAPRRPGRCRGPAGSTSSLKKTNDEQRELSGGGCRGGRPWGLDLTDRGGGRPRIPSFLPSAPQETGSAFVSSPPAILHVTPWSSR